MFAALHRESVAKVIRTFLIAFLALTIPGVFGWLNAITDWAAGQGQTPFPDARSLGFLAVSGIAAGAVAILNLLWLYVEDLTGKGFLRDPAADKHIQPKPLTDGGHISLPVNVPLYAALAWLVLAAVIFSIPWLLLQLL